MRRQIPQNTRLVPIRVRGNSNPDIGFAQCVLLFKFGCLFLFVMEYVIVVMEYVVVVPSSSPQIAVEYFNRTC